MNHIKRRFLGGSITLAIMIMVSAGNSKAQQYEDWKPHINCWCKGYSAGQIVKHKEFNDIPLYWEASFWALNDAVPGEWIDSGGVSPWIMLNSKAVHTEKEYSWIGWNSNCSKYKIYRPKGTHDIVVELDGSWGDQLDKKGPGVYVPTWRDGAEAAYSMILEGLGTNSYEHHYEPAVEVAQEYPWIDLGVSTIVGDMDEKEWLQAQMMVESGHEILNGGYTTETAYPYYKSFFINDTLPSGDSLIPLPLQNLVVGAPDAVYELITVSIPYLSFKSGAVADTQFIEKTFYVRDYEYNVVNGAGLNRGFIKPNGLEWNEKKDKNETALKLQCTPGWFTLGESEGHIVTARDMINRNVYDKVDSSGEVRCDYFVYNRDHYSNETHDSLIAAGYVGAKGGSNRGILTPGDFYDPFRTHFDNFYMKDVEAMKVYPDNPYMWFSLQGLVDNLIKSKGYMTRSFAGCVDVDSWQDTEELPGSIPKSLLAKHFRMLDEKYRNHEITVGTPSEIAKYRIMADAVRSAELSKSPNGHGYILHVEMDSIPEEYRCDISFIVKFEERHENALGWHYTSHEDIRLEYEPRKMDDEGKAWSVSFNPFHGDLYYEDHTCIGEECDHVIGTNGKTAIVEHKSLRSQPVYKGMNQRRVLLALPAGDYHATIHTLSGRSVVSSRLHIKNSGGNAQLSTNGLAQGVYLLTVQNSEQVVLKEKLIIK